ncbi:MAG: hypothetical protein RL120_02725 [Gammaproteobacteria bacterium]
MNEPQSKQTQQNSHRLLVIDDNKGITDIINEVGTEAGYSVTCINDYETLPGAYRQVEPNYIFLDLDLGIDKEIELGERGFDGLAVLQFLSEQGCNAKIIIISGSDKDKREITAKIGRELNLDVRGSMGKPFKVDVIEQVLLKLKQL